jgi:hypothetical protein
MGVMYLGYVYFVQVGSRGDIKIGYSTNIMKRMNSLSSSMPENIKLLGYITGDLNREKELHKMFRILNVKGEWFRCDKSIIEYLNLVNEMRMQTGMMVHIELDENMNTCLYGKIQM